jgi:hypothetical protein
MMEKFVPARVKAELPAELYQYGGKGRVLKDIYPETHLLGFIPQPPIGSPKPY